MRQLDVDKLKPDAFAKTVSELNGKFVCVTGYVRSTKDNTVSIGKSQTSLSHIEFARTALLAAFEDEEGDSRVTLLIAKDAQVNVVRRCDASQIETCSTCGCEPADVGVAEARPYESIHPALAKLKAEIREIRGAIGTGAGSRNLKCELAYRDALIAAKNGDDIDNAQMTRDLCLLGIDGPGDPSGILW